MSSWLTSEWADELRSLWNDYDPIGVYHFDEGNEWPKDEYDSYHGMIIAHLNKRSSSETIFKALKHLVTVNMGMNWNSHLDTDTQNFLSNILVWFENKKPELSL